MDRFDDVEFRILEEPEPRRPRRRSKVASLVTVTVAAGLFATSALAFTDKPAAPAQKPAKSSEFKRFHHHGCRHGDKRWDRDRGGDESLGLRY